MSAPHCCGRRHARANDRTVVPQSLSAFHCSETSHHDVRHHLVDVAEMVGLIWEITRAIVVQVRRNQGRFPPDFMSQLTEAEHEALRSHFATSNGVDSGRG